MTLNNPNIDLILNHLLNTSNLEQVAGLLREHRKVLLVEGPARLEHYLAQQRQGEQDMQVMATLIACRRLLHDYQTHDLATAIAAQPGWPLARQAPLYQLLRLFPNNTAVESIRLAQRALEDIDPERDPDLYGLVHYFWGLSCQDQAEAEDAPALEQAIDHFEIARQSWDQTDNGFDEFDVARAHSNLGRLYLRRYHSPDRRTDIETALACFAAVEQIFGPERSDTPEEYFNTLLLTGDAYIDRLEGERLENFEQAILAYDRAYELAKTFKDNGTRLAEVEHNLAVAHRIRLRGNRATNFEKAREYAEAALSHLSQGSKAYARTAAELATIYGHRLHGDRRENLETAIDYAEQALAIYQPEIEPRRWALLKLNLGSLYSNNRNYTQALHCFEQVLNRTSRQVDPLRWADAMNNMGVAYADLSQKPQDEAYLQAVDCFKHALTIRRWNTMPVQARRTATNWGDLAFQSGRYAEALVAFQTARRAGETLYQVSATEAGRRAELAEVSGLAAKIAFCLLKLNRPHKALRQLEQDKTRLLSQALLLSSVKKTDVPPHQKRDLDQARGEVRNLQARINLLPPTEPPETRINLGQELGQAHQALTQLIESIRQQNPDFMPAGLTVAEILKLVPAGGALVAPLVTPQGGVVFVLPAGQTTLKPEFITWLPHLTTDTLTDLLVGTEERAGWFRCYLQYLTQYRAAYRQLIKAREEKKPELEAAALAQLQMATRQWQAAIAQFTGQLWSALMAPIHRQLQTLAVKPHRPVLLLPPGGLGLLPLHAAWRQTNGTNRAFLDDYPVTYNPSAYVRQTSQRRADRPHPRSLLAVVDPTHNLAYAATEGQQVGRQFADAHNLAGAAATLAAVQDRAKDYAYLHFACHGTYDWQDVMQSHLQLADEELLSLAKIVANLNLQQTRLVTLSACETGLTEFQETPDEYIGLPAGFLQAGAPGVVSTLWAVDDLSTMLLMERFYQNHLQQGLAIAEALRQAQLWLRDVTAEELQARFSEERQTLLGTRMPAAVVTEQYRRFSELDRGERPFAHPFYWAAFTFSGA